MLFERTMWDISQQGKDVFRLFQVWAKEIPKTTHSAIKALKNSLQNMYT